MSSPPNSATSPSYSSVMSLPKKRPSLGPTGPASAKRRKPSSVTSSTHPLRQTSFPPPESISRRTSYSPTVEGSATPSVRRGRGRPRKNALPTDARSATAASARSRKQSSAAPDGPADAAHGAVGREEEDGEDDEDDGQEDAVMEDGGTMGEATQKQEKEHLAMLLGAFTPEQQERYEVWRRVRLKKEVVRRITNQTLSQSVPQSVVIAINGMTKVFAGELIERARDVQSQWMAAARDLPTEEANDGTAEERDRGPLLPDHLREALRLYKKDKEGGGAGFQGLSLHGKEHVASRTMGKRLFR